MRLSELKNHLSVVNKVSFRQANGTIVPGHFHITEAGLASKHFIDCGGTIREEKAINFQLWTSTDTGHRLEPNKLLNIISKSDRLFGADDLEVDVEYQTETIGKYGLDFKDETFIMTTKFTDCLAKDHCGVTEEKKLKLVELQDQSSCCTPDIGCC